VTPNSSLPGYFSSSSAPLSQFGASSVVTCEPAEARACRVRDQFPATSFRRRRYWIKDCMIESEAILLKSHGRLEGLSTRKKP
jgi:hypothetical protein